MRLIQRVGIVVVVVAIAAVGAFGATKLANPSLPKAEPVTQVVLLDQGWSDAERRRFHETSQGSLLLPVAWMHAAEQGFFSSRKLTDPATLAGLRFTTDRAPGEGHGPDGLPVGWTIASWPSPDGRWPAMPKVGFTCAACHTGQLNFHGTAIRIEGGGAMLDAAAFEKMVGTSILATWLLPWKRERFVDAVTAETGQSRKDVTAMLRGVYEAALTAAKTSALTPLYVHEGYGRTDALQRIANTLLADDTDRPDNNRVGDGPVKYPYLWDIGRLDWVQYNASVRRPMGRNVAEALGLRAEVNFVSRTSPHTLTPEPDRWKSSVSVSDIAWMEQALGMLRPPKWPAELPPLDEAKVAAGKDLFQQHCAACHGIRVTANNEWRVAQVPLSTIGTDPKEATNFITGRYAGDAIGVPGQIDAATALRLTTDNIVENAYAREGFTAAQRAAADGVDRQEHTVANAVYKARPLVGIWASPPYLHNGSVPTLYDMLSPQRPAKFFVGTREYDPVKVGYVSDRPFSNAMEFDTSAPGNSNAGHWFSDDNRLGRLGPAFSDAERYAIIEYLKAATYSIYPCRDAATGRERVGPDPACGRGPQDTPAAQ